MKNALRACMKIAPRRKMKNELRSLSIKKQAPEWGACFDKDFAVRLDLAVEGLALGQKVISGNLEALADTLLTLLQVGAGIVYLLVTHLTVNLEHAVDVLAHVENDGLGESVLGVGVDVHLNNAVGDSLTDVAKVGTGTTVEYETHVVAVLLLNNGLTVAKDGGLELNSTRLVYAVYVTEGSSKHELAYAVKGLVGLKHVSGRGVELLSGSAAGVNAVFLTTYNTDLDLENDTELSALCKELLGELKVLSHGKGGSVKHVGVEQGAFALSDALLALGKEGTKEAVNLVSLAVVGVQSNEYVVLLSEAMYSLSENDGADGGILHGSAGSELATAQRNLDDAVRLSLSKSLEGAVDDLDGGHVDGRIGIALLLGRVKHLDVLFLCRYRHGTYFCLSV